MKNNKFGKIVFMLTTIICITIIVYSFITLYNQWYDESKEFTKISEKQIESVLENERISFLHEYFPVFSEPFDYDILYQNMENVTKEELENYLNTNLFNKITVSDCLVDYILVDSKEYEDYNKYNYTAYFYDKEYYLDNLQKDEKYAKVSMDINIIEYYPGNCKIEIPID